MPAGSTRGMTFCHDVVIIGDDSHKGNTTFSITFGVVNDNDVIQGREVVIVTIVEGK